MNSCTNNNDFISAINDLFTEQIPFNKIIGLRVESISYECSKVSIQMRDELMGHYKRGMLHGGAISTVIDVAGGLAAFMGVQQRMHGESSLESRIERFSRVSTIDLRVDFLRPGTGSSFVATGYVMRTGNKIAVTRIELNNDKNQLIAAGTGTYVVA